MSDKNKNDGPMQCGPGRIGWNELVTTDLNAAKAFYTQLFGWKAEPFGPQGGYNILKKDDATVAGIMQAPQPGIPAQWLAYTVVEDVDGVAAKTAALGGKVLMPPFDVAQVGRIAVLADGQGAAFGVFKPLHKQA